MEYSIHCIASLLPVRVLYAGQPIVLRTIFLALEAADQAKVPFAGADLGAQAGQVNRDGAGSLVLHAMDGTYHEAGLARLPGGEDVAVLAGQTEINKSE
jgi:hypothetical protein